MLNRIIQFSIKNKLIIGLFTIGLMAYGIYQMTKLPIDAVPDITNNQVQVITTAPSFGAIDIERLVTFPIEQANNNISGLKEIRSFSRFGLSLVTIVFEDEIDIYWARQQVAERLQKIQSQIPVGIGVPELGPVSTGLGEIYQYVIRPQAGYEKKYDVTALRTIQDWIVRRQLLGVKGVADVSSFGGKLKQYEVAIRPNQLQAHGISVNDIFKALEMNNQNTGGAYIEKGPTALFIRSEGLIKNVEDIKNIAVKTLANGTPLLMKDVAEVNIGFATRYGALCYNDMGEVSGAVVLMLKGANSSEVVKNVKDRVEQIKKTLPEGILLEPFLDRTKMVNNAIATVEKNLAEGALIVLFILVLFLGNWRAGLIVASVIPLALLFAIILMNTFGVSGNLMSLGALDFGLIVDGAVIIVEAVMHQITKHKSFKTQIALQQKEMDEEVQHAAGKMMNSAVFGQLIILIVYLPIFSLRGIEGKMFQPMAQTVAFALLGAFVLSLTYIPMMSALCLSKKKKMKNNLSDKALSKLEFFYQKQLSNVLAYPKITLGSVATLFLLAIIIMTQLGGEFIPALEEGDFAIETRVLTGSNLKTTIASTSKTAHILKTQFPEVEKVVTKIGSGEIPTDPMPMEAADMMVILKDKKDWTSAKTFDALAEKMTKALEVVPGVTTSFQFPVQMRFNELMTGAKQDVVCKLFGEDLDTLSKYAAKLGHIINTVEGAKELYLEPITGMPQVVIALKRDLLSQYQVNIEDINRVINISLAGQSSGQVFEGEKRFDLVVKLKSEARQNLEDIKNLLIPTPQQQIPLHNLAEITIQVGPNQIQREDAKRRIIAGFNVSGRDVQSIVNELQQKVEAQIKLPVGYFVSYGGAFENLNAAKQRLMIAVPIALILIFLLLYFAFSSIKHSLLIYTAIPLSAIGGIFFLALREMPFSISAGVGFIALFGVAVLNGIVLIAEFNRLKKEGVLDLKQIVLEGTKLRLRPVLMTASVASLGFLPMALSNGAGAEVQRPLATVVIGGLLIATFLTLFVLPMLYIIFEKGSLKKLKPNSALLILIFSSCGVLFSQVQPTISKQAAIDSALKNNWSIKNEKLKTEYQKKIIKTSLSIAPTNISGEFGQINSIYSDNRIGINQGFSFPTVYLQQKQLLQAEWQSAVFNLAIKEIDVKKRVEQLFYTYLNYQEKEKLLIKNDSLYQNFSAKARLRLEKGESNVLEKVSAEHLSGQIRLQLKQVQTDLNRLRLEFNLLINTTLLYAPLETESPWILKTGDTNQLKQHPYLKRLEQEVQVSNYQQKLERAKLFPEFNIGYFNMSMRGNGADNVNYTGASRFQSLQLGLGIPLFFGAQKAKLNAAHLQNQIANQEYLIAEQQLKNQIQALTAQFLSYQENNLYYTSTALKQADIIAKTAQEQYEQGLINYLDWVMLMNQAIQIESDYIDLKQKLNACRIELNYLNAK